MGFSGGGSNVLKSHRHDGTVVQDGGSLDFNNITQSNSSAGQIFYSDGVHLQQLAYPAVPNNETLTAVAASTEPSWVAGGGSPIWTDGGSDVSAVSVSDLTVSAIPAHDVLQVVFSVGSDDGGNNCKPCIRINGIATATYNSLYTATSSSAVSIKNEVAQDQWEIGKIISSATFSGTFYIYSPNSNLSTAFDGTMMRGITFNSTNGITHIIDFCGDNANTDAITSVELFFEQDDHTAEDIRGSLQVNTLSY